MQACSKRPKVRAFSLSEPGSAWSLPLRLNAPFKLDPDLLGFALSSSCFLRRKSQKVTQLLPNKHCAWKFL